jgi:hypothetical protein
MTASLSDVAQRGLGYRCVTIVSLLEICPRDNHERYIFLCIHKLMLSLYEHLYVPSNV